MKYKFVIEKFTSPEDNSCMIEIVESQENLSLLNALKQVECFALDHPNGYLLNCAGHPVEYELEGAELSCWVDFMDQE